MISYKSKLQQINSVLQVGGSNGLVTILVIGHFAALSLVINFFVSDTSLRGTKQSLHSLIKSAPYRVEIASSFLLAMTH